MRPECRRIDESGHEADAAEVPGQAVGVRRKGVRHNRGRARASARTNRHREGADETNRGCLAGNTSGRHSKIADAVAESAALPAKPGTSHADRGDLPWVKTVADLPKPRHCELAADPLEVHPGFAGLQFDAPAEASGAGGVSTEARNRRSAGWGPRRPACREGLGARRKFHGFVTAYNADRTHSTCPSASVHETPLKPPSRRLFPEACYSCFSAKTRQQE